MKLWRDTGQAMEEALRQQRSSDCLWFRILHGMDWQSAHTVGLAIGGRYPAPR